MKASFPPAVAPAIFLCAVAAAASGSDAWARDGDDATDGVRTEAAPAPVADAGPTDAGPMPGESEAARAARLGPGDELEMTVVGVPELDKVSVVEGNGLVSLPLFGEVDVGGRSLADVRADLRAHIAGEVFQRYDPQGSTRLITLEEDQLLLTLVGRPPVFVTGDVADPGEHPYSQGLTVRQAVALSGGYGRLRRLEADALLLEADLLGAYDRLTLRAAELLFDIARLEAELAGEDEMPGGVADDLPLGEAVRDRITWASAELLRERVDRRAEELAYLARAITQTDEQIEALAEQSRLQGEEIEAARRDLEAAEALSERGLVQSDRLSARRQATLLSQTVSLDTSVELLRARNSRDELAHRRDSLSDEWRIEALGELEEARAEAAAALIERRAAAEKMALSDARIARLASRADAGPRAEIVVHRAARGGGDALSLMVGPNFRLLPGDVVEVALIREELPLLE